MKIPKARKLPSGAWFIQLRLGGESISITNFDKKKCEKEAEYIKAEYKAGKRVAVVPEPENGITLTQMIDKYIEDKNNALSPATVRGYRSIQRNRFKTEMAECERDIHTLNWQAIVSREATSCSPKYLKNSYAFLSSVVEYQTGRRLPEVKLPGAVPKKTAFLMPEEVLKFVDAVKDTEIAVPALLALSSMRMSEISALDWSAIPPNPNFIRTNGAVVLGEGSVWTRKSQNKNESSARNIPILIPELKEAIERDRKKAGPVLAVPQNCFRRKVHRICQREGLTDVTVHGLRHSFASLAYHLNVPKKYTMEIGGWKDDKTMEKIYTHIAQSDITRYKTEMAKFFERKPKNANENANDPGDA